MSSELLDRAIEQIKSGEKRRGQQLLALALVEDPQNVRGWLWLSACVAEAEKKRYCLQKALEVAPDLETVQRALAELPSPAASEILTEPITFRPETAPTPEASATSDRKTLPIRPAHEMPSFEASPTRPVVHRPNQEKTKPTQRRQASSEEGGWAVQDSPRMERRVTLIVVLLVILIGVLLATVLTYFYLL